MERLKFGIAIVLAVSAGVFVYGARAQSDRKSQKRADQQYREWRMFGGGPDNIHYSTLDQITRDNVHRLEVAWRFDSGDEFPGSEMQCNPLIVHDTLFASTPKLRIIALNAATGKLIWSFQTSQLWKASPMTYQFDNQQYVAIAAGSNIIAFGLQ